MIKCITKNKKKQSSARSNTSFQNFTKFMFLSGKLMHKDKNKLFGRANHKKVVHSHTSDTNIGLLHWTV